jgi:competence protein ComEC
MKHRLWILLGILFFALLMLLFFGRKDIQALFEKNFGKEKNIQVSEQSNDLPIKITFLDIGQGDASFIEWGDGTQMLVDCAIDSRILEALGRVMDPRDRSIDYLMVTHPDQDHYGGCVDVLRRFEVENIIYTGYEKSSSKYFPVFQQYVKDEQAQFIEITAQEKWNLNSSTIHFLYPDTPIAMHPVVKKIGKGDASNNTSIVFTLEYQNKKVLFTGDAEKETEEYLIKKYGEALDVDVLKVGHHGSAGSSIDNFLALVKPEYAVISAGKDNAYGHPAPRTLRRLARVYSEVWRTDEKGDILVQITKDGVYVQSQ